MFIRFLDGPFKGEIKDMQDAGAVELIKAGRAENPYLNSEPAPPPKVESAQPKKHRRGSR
jgi:hypothetical protein